MDRSHLADRRERIPAMDLLRGIAILGILLVNIRLFAYPNTAVWENGFMPGGGDEALWFSWITRLLAERKFLALFSMLFGAGLVLHAEKMAAMGLDAERMHRRRMAWLLGIGIVHAYLIWQGDILVPYAMAGFFAFYFKDLPPAKLLLWGVGLLALGGAIELITQYLFFPQSHSERLVWNLENWKSFQTEFQTFQSGYFPQFLFRAKWALWYQTSLFFSHSLFFLLGWFFIGMAALRRGYLSRNPVGILRFRFRMLFISCLLIFGVILAGTRHFPSIPGVSPGAFLIWWLWDFLLPIGYLIGGIQMATRFGKTGFLRFMARFSRYSFSIYLLQSLLCSWVFYGWGLGWFGIAGPLQLVWFVVCIWSLSLGLVFLGQRFWESGPMERIWRYLVFSVPSLPVRPK